MKLVTILLMFVGFSTTFYAQDHLLRGKLTDASSGEAVISQKVNLLNAANVVVRVLTDNDGIFSFPKMAIGEYRIIIYSADFDTLSETISIKTATGLTNKSYQLTPKTSTIDIEISAESRTKTTEVGASVISLNQKGLERIPSVGAENDIVSAFSVTPGVVTTGDQGGQLYVRGGTPIQNKILLEGMTIYSPFHSIGFFSVFETELVKNVDIYTGGFDAQYGGRISSVLDISYRDGNKKKIGGKVSISPFMAKVVLEGPLKKSKTGSGGISYILSAKHALISQTSKTLYKRINDKQGMPFDFTDIFAKVTFAGDNGSKASVFGFHNDDQVNYFGLARLGWKATGGGVNFTLVPPGNNLLIRGHVNGSSYNVNFDEYQNQDDTIKRFSGIGGVELGFDFTYYLTIDSELNYGIAVNSFNTKFETYNDALRKISDDNSTTELSGYINYRKATGRWVIQPSFRMQYYASLSTFSPEPRLGIKLNATDKLRFKFAGGRYSQNFTSAASDKDVVNLFNGLLSAPTNVQENFVNEQGKSSSITNGIQYAWHAISGIEIDVTKKISLNIEPYFKYFSRLSNLNTKKQFDENDVAFADQPDLLKKDFIIESGKTYGIDISGKYTANRLYIWAVYSLGKSTRWDGIEQYAPVFDRRHNANIVGSYTIGKKRDLEVSIRWSFGSGLPFTPSAGFFQGQGFNQGITTNILSSNQGEVTLLPGKFNSERLPTYHRLDITVKKQFIFKNKTVLELTGGITNLYDRQNIFYVNRFTYKRIFQFPFLPSFGLSYKF